MAVPARLDDLLSWLRGKLHVDATTIESVSLAAGGATNRVPHGLGRRLVGWKLVRKRANANVWDVQDSGADPRTYLYLMASAAVVVDLEVY